jgi:site-specific DNA-cytosine methylase
MNVLVACEFSGVVREAFAARGHHAVSCDFLETEISPTNGSEHHQGCVSEVLRRHHWDLMVAFPPCTHLAVSGARWWGAKGSAQADAIEFVRMLADQRIKRIAIENPIGRLSSVWRKPDQIIHPWQFGHGETKATCIWLKGLPKLMATDIVEGRNPRVHHEPPSTARWKNRSRTYQGIADAMAKQWGAR